MIEGNTAAEIAGSVRALIQTGALSEGDALPAIRDLAARAGVNRNTVAAAYAQLAAAGVVQTRRRGGTVVLGVPRSAGEGHAASDAAINLASGNPDRALLPSPAAAIAGYAAPLYGEPEVDPALDPLAADGIPAGHRLVLTHGAADGMERLLHLYLARGDRVAVEDPGYLAAIGMLRVNGYRAAPVPVDAAGMSAAGLRAALDAGARAVICTPRAHNPTGGGVTRERAAELRAVLTAYPAVTVIEDDHFSMISARRYHRITPEGHPRWAVVRSVAKFLGPDLRLALVRADPVTADRLAARLAAGSGWVSHLLQHCVARLWDAVPFDRVRDTYAGRIRLLTDALGERGIGVDPRTDGLNVWIPVPSEAEVVAGLAARGWVVRPGRDFAAGGAVAPAIRVTTSTITAAQATGFAAGLATLL
ncbi:GntR family transcriptional regulator [Actinoplanes sp. SE50]|uniref:aminotransferase class I/II-fold pyridoxal phosphate-dependent enzyme n=1 Tax=unclassified Actinoplanes TaxID=2626549 RepID=UPI00023ECECA|nr:MULTISPECIES: aminotransferase class I/II-fold pyridoxal phosphate-dependent enzyme [unclassified Actinoplanes]AEV85495.1 yjiR-like uncharacterized HTH-type transcriptional regulator [Actinoplanes sp. SE50/110]ATO83888.1 GntR family transcriptional regulator [Actinoplanes sp. SE50]SLM01298.1 GntR family transcriptional regulator [Actinoplanes sp. SE50/110]